MKQVLLFLLLFGSGFAVLWWFEETSDSNVAPKSLDLPNRPLRPMPEHASLGVHMRGRTIAIMYDERTGNISMRVESQESRTEDGVDRLGDVTLTLFDPNAANPSAAAPIGELDAAEASLPRIASGGIQPEYERTVTLTDVSGRFNKLLAGSRLDFKTESALIDASKDAHVTLSGDVAIDFDSPEYRGGADSYFMDFVSASASTEAGVRGPEQLIELRKNGWLEFDREFGANDETSGSGRFASTGEGSLQIRRGFSHESRPFFFESWEGSELVFTGEESSTLTCDHTLIRCRQSNAKTSSEVDAGKRSNVIRLEKIEADGNVRWRSAESLFTSEKCEVNYVDGKFSHALLTGGFPTMVFKVALDPETLSKLAPELEPPDLQTVRIVSEETIFLSREGGELSYRVSAPATVETQGANLRSNGELTGSVRDDGSELSFKGEGGIVFEFDALNAVLEAAQIDIRVSTQDLKLATMRGEASGGVRFVGTLDDGRTFAVTSPDRIVFEHSGDQLRVVEGFDVEFSVEGDGGFFARCDHLINLSLDDESFEAEGNVVFRSGQRVARCDRLQSNGPAEYTLWGTPEARAVFTSPQGRAEALQIEIELERIHASGSVTATITSLPETTTSQNELEFDGYEIDSDDLVLQRSSGLLSSGVFVRHFELIAAGNVRSRLNTGARTVVLRSAEYMTAKRADRFGSEAHEAVRLGSTTELFARGSVDSRLLFEDSGDEQSFIDVVCDELEVTRNVVGHADAVQHMQARGHVRFNGIRGIKFEGTGETLTLGADGIGHLDAPETGRVTLSGELPTHELPFRLNATRAEFSADRIEAFNPDLRVTRRLLSGGESSEDKTAYRTRADRLIATKSTLELIHNVRFQGSTTRHIPWTLEANRVVVQGRASETRTDPAELSRITATGGVVFNLGTLVVARADSLFGVGPTGILRLTGAPVTITTPGKTLSAEWIDFDPELQIIIEARNGKIVGVADPGGDGAPAGIGSDPLMQGASEDEEWSLEFQWATTRTDQDSLVYFMQEPVFSYPKTGYKLRASWSVMWIDRDQWRSLPDRKSKDRSGRRSKLASDRSGATDGPMKIFFDFLESNQVSGLVREAYFEGPVEVFSGDERLAHADAVYFDLTSGHGWLANTTLNIIGTVIGQDFEKLTIKANWMRHSRDGSLRADSATITPCDHAKPHLQIATGDLHLRPLSNERDAGYQVEFKDNRIELYDLFRIPLPPIAFDTDEELKPSFPSIRFGNTARFGQLFGLKISRPAKRLGRWIDGLFSFDDDEEEEEEELSADEEAALTPEEQRARDKAKRQKRKQRKRNKALDARWDLDASYLGSRGALLDLGFRIKGSEHYWFEFNAGVALDDGKDKGYVRVPDDDRESVRLWLHSRGAVETGFGQFLFAYSDQSDPGVQSEFFEREYVRYEQDETYLQWKRADGHNWTQVSVEPRVDEFRAAIEELPSATVFSGRAALFDVGSIPLVHSGSLSAGYLRRRAPAKFDLDGDGFTDTTLTGPFAPSGVYADGGANASVARVDLFQRIEAPLSLGALGLKLTPFASVRGTAWSRAADDDEASRLVVEAGARLSTVLWRNRESGSFDQVAPFVEYRTEIDSDVDGTPFQFDETESAVFGDFLSVGLRSRFNVTDLGSRFDLDLRGTYASNRSDGMPDGWLPLEVFGRAGIDPGGRIFTLWYDGRIDAEAGEVVYSLFSLGTRFGDKAGVQVGHHYGRDSSFVKLFDAATVSGFYRWTEKWEFEAGQSFSLLDARRLGTRFLLRRYGHDLIFEIETEFREGEGSSANFSVRPRIGFRPNRIGYTRW